MDTGVATCLASGDKDPHYASKDFYAQITDSERCYVSPITVAETLNNPWFYELGSRRRSIIENLVLKSKCLKIDKQVAYMYAQVDLDNHNLPNVADVWQIAIAKRYGPNIATLDKGIARMSNIVSVAICPLIGR